MQCANMCLNFPVVYRHKLQLVAVKKLLVNDPTKDQLADFYNEIKILRSAYMCNKNEGKFSGMCVCVARSLYT